MNWQETVMKVEQVNAELGDTLGYGIDDWLKGLLETQAQITGDIAYKAGIEKVVKAVDGMGFTYLGKWYPLDNFETWWLAFKESLAKGD